MRTTDVATEDQPGGPAPAVGALLLAFDAAGIAVDAPLLARLTATLPPATLFSTE